MVADIPTTFFTQIMNSRHEQFGCSFIDMDLKWKLENGIVIV